jgi:long-subunit fatty acid transport protein
MPRRIAPVLVTLLLSVSAARALTDEEVFRDFRFNLINPGARSLALGGAFISLADDATAAQANPAGLGFLLRPEYFAEIRSIDNEADSEIRTESLPADIDTFVATGTDLDDSVSPTFLSAVTVYKRRDQARTSVGQWAMGLSRQELLDIESTTLSSFRFTFGQSTPGAFLAEGEGRIDVDIVNWNVSAGVRATNRLGFGATLTLSQLDVKSEVVNTVVDTGPTVADQEILEPIIDLRTSVDDDDEDVVVSFGAIYKYETETAKWSVGAVYRMGPSFEVAERIDPLVDNGNGQLDPGDSGIDLFGVRNRLGTRFTNRFSLPDVAGIGGSWVPFREGALTLALDVERIMYSNLMDGYVSGVNILTDFDARFDIDDGTDVHAGAEYLLFETGALPPLALRAGAFSESESTIRATSTGTVSFATEDVFQGRDRQLHGAAGLGLIWRDYVVDVAADFSDSDNEYVVSFIYKGK